MMIEANPDLTTAEMKEILKLTAERRGEASAPDVDPFWNRDFGWGMVDAYEAVKLAMYLAEENLTGTVDVSTQVHILNSSVNATTGLHELQGVAWGQAGSVSRLNSALMAVRGWRPLTKPLRAAWLRSSGLSGWSHSTLTALMPATSPLRFVASTNKGAPSLSVFAEVVGTGAGDGESMDLGVNLLTLSAFLVLLILVGLLVQGAQIDPPGTLHSLNEAGPVEAVLLDEADSPENEGKVNAKAPKS